MGEREGIRIVFRRVINKCICLVKVFADGGYEGVNFQKLVNETYGWVLEIVKRSDSQKGFVVLPKRWIVERTFSWLNRFRRLSKDYEYDTRTSETMIRWAMIRIMLKRLNRGASYSSIGYKKNLNVVHQL